MIELDFIIPPTVEVDGHYLEVIVHPAATSHAGHEDLVHVTLYPIDERGKRLKVTGPLIEHPTVTRTEDAILAQILLLADKASKELTRQASRRRLLRKTT